MKESGKTMNGMEKEHWKLLMDGSTSENLERMRKMENLVALKME